MKIALLFNNIHTFLLQFFLGFKVKSVQRSKAASYYIVSFCSIACQYFFHSFDFVIVALGLTTTVDASANTNIGCDSLRSLGMQCSVTVVYGLGYL